MNSKKKPDRTSGIVLSYIGKMGYGTIILGDCSLASLYEEDRNPHSTKRDPCKGDSISFVLVKGSNSSYAHDWELGKPQRTKPPVRREKWKPKNPRAHCMLRR